MSERLRRYAPRPGLSESNRKRASHLAMVGTKTGPKSEAGRRASAQRARQHGAYGAEAYALRAWLRTIVRLVNACRVAIDTP